MTRKIIFFANVAPDDPRAWLAFHYANAALEEGLEAEIRLAGDAVKLAQDAVLEAAGPDSQLAVAARKVIARGVPITL